MTAQNSGPSDKQVTPGEGIEPEKDSSRNPWAKLLNDHPTAWETAEVESSVSVDSGRSIVEARSTDAISAAAMVLTLLFIVQVCLTAFPLSLNDPGQLLSVISELISLSPLLMLGALLFFLRACRHKVRELGGQEEQTKTNRKTSKMRWSAQLGGMLYLLLIPTIVFASMDLRTVGLRNLNAQRISQTEFITRASLKLSSATPGPQSIETTKEEIRDYMLRFNIDMPGVDLKQISTREPLIGIMTGLQQQAQEQYLDKRFIADNDLMRRSLRNGIGALLYSCFLIYLGINWP